MQTHHPYNGRPFYCIKCGMGYAEYVACELPDCELEMADVAEQRAADFLAKKKQD